MAQLFQRKSLSPDRLHTTRIETFSGSTLDKLSAEASDAIDILESAETVRSMWYDEVKTILQALCSRVTI